MRLHTHVSLCPSEKDSHACCPLFSHSTLCVTVCVCLCIRERLSASRGGGGGGGEEKSDSGDLALYSPLKVVIFVGLMCLMLVLMYFFYKYLGESFTLHKHCLIYLYYIFIMYYVY